MCLFEIPLTYYTQVTYDLVARAANHCWSNKFLDVFRDFFADNAYIFKDAPQIMGEQDMVLA